MQAQISLAAPHRWATRADASVLARLVNFAGEGMPLYLWEKMGQESGESAWDIGAQRAQRESGAFSYRNTIVREEDGAIVAGHRCEGQPNGYDLIAVQSPMGGILMPGDEAAVAWFLGIEMRRPCHDVRPDQGFDDIENAVVAHQVVDPREHEMALVAILAVDRAAGFALVGLQPGEQVCGVL